MASEVAQVRDSAGERLNVYNYDNGNNLSSFEQKNILTPNTPLFSMTQSAPNKTQYTIKQSSFHPSEEIFETEITYDENIALAPRLLSTKHFEGSSSAEISDFNKIYKYDKLGRMSGMYSSEQAPYAREVNLEYYDSSLIKSVKTKYGSYENTTTYLYDSRGNITNISDDSPLGSFPEQYIYDGLDRLGTEKNNNNGIQRGYTYNKEGTIGSIDDYDDSGRLKINMREYDVNGNLKSFTSPSSGASISLSYSRNNHLLSEITSPNASKITYNYNYQNVRLNKKIDNNQTTYWLDGSKILVENRPDGSALRYIYDATGIQGFRYKASANASYTNYTYIKDILGSIRGILQGNTLICRYAYSAFGETLVFSASGSPITSLTHIARINPFRWKSYYFDEETGYYAIYQYGRTRYYEPSAKQFIDPLNLEELNPTQIGGLNRYGLGVPNPLMFPPNPVNIFTSMPLSWRDPEVTLTWVQQQAVPGKSSSLNWLGNAFNWYNDLHWGWKLGLGIVAFVGAVAVTVATGGAVLPLAAKFALGVGISTLAGAAFSGLKAVVNGGNFWEGAKEGAWDGFVEGVFWGGMASLGSATKQALRGMPSGMCFKAGTLVLTESGHKPIEDIQEGDLVWAYNEETGENNWKPVVQLFRNTTSSWICTEVEVDGETEKIKSTPGHMYYLPKNTENRNIGKQLEHKSYEGISEKWVSAEDLKKGDKVLLSDGRYGIVKGIKLEKLDKLETTYNFEIEDFHTYYVGGNSICVHNAGAPCGGKQYYDSIKDHPDYPQDFQRIQNGKTVNPVKNKPLLNELRQDFPGDWSKIYNNGYATNSATGQVGKVSLHYNQHTPTGKIFDFEPHWGKWS